MRKLRVLALGVLFLSFCPSILAQSQLVWHMAFCTDGDGPLTNWIASRADAAIAGRDHEKANPGHRWEILTQQGRVAADGTGCAAIADDPTRPDTVRVVNTCGACRIIRVSRRYKNGSVKTKEFKIKPKAQKRFLKQPDTEIIVEGEFVCPKG